MIKVAIIYQMWPHYRLAVALELDKSSLIDYTFYGSGKKLEGIEHLDSTLLKRFVAVTSKVKGRLVWQQGAIEAATGSKYDAIIFLANPNHFSTWVAAIAARLRGVRVLFWGHGWLRQEVGAKRYLRTAFYRLANHLLVYSERGKQLGIEAGWCADRITVVYNSLDVSQADGILAEIESGVLDDHVPHRLFDQEDRPLIICTARLTSKCRFDLLLEAALLLEQRGQPINIMLVGDGPERARLEEIASQASLSVYFYGACYDEEVTGQLIYHADLTVSPGKIGLTALHSLMYGTPAITHDDLDEQMPEVEAIKSGLTGAFFTSDSGHSLADAIDRWLVNAPERSATRIACRAAVHGNWNPQTQAAIIEQAILKVVRPIGGQKV